MSDGLCVAMASAFWRSSRIRAQVHPLCANLSQLNCVVQSKIQVINLSAIGMDEARKADGDVERSS